MSLAWPGALLALLALAVPVAIHILQQGQHRTVDVATTRFLRDSTRQRWRRLAVDRPLLLAVRCLLLTAAALLLAEPFTTPPMNAVQGEPGWVAVSPQVPLATALAMTGGGDAEWRWLSAGFPDVDSPPPATRPADIFSLVAEADATLRADQALTVVLPADGALLGARRPALQRDVQWLLAPSTAPAPSPLADVLVVFDPSRQADALWLQAAFAAWSDAGVPVDVRLVQSDAVGALAGWTFWLSSAALPRPEASSGSLTVVTDRADGPDGAIASVDKAQATWRVTHWWDGPLKRLNVGAGLTANSEVTGKAEFAETLLGVLAGDGVQQPPAGYPVTAAQLTATVSGRANDVVRRESQSALFALLVVGLWCLERTLSAWSDGRVTND